MSVRVAVIDSHSIFRVGLSAVLDAEPDLLVVASAASVKEAMPLLVEHEPHVVVIDADGAGGSRAAADIMRAHPRMRLIFLTASQRQEDVTAALEMGASAYILKTISPRLFVETLRQTLVGETYISPDLATRLIFGAKATPGAADPASVERSKRLATLTKRERDILQELSAGQTNKEIARQLDITEKTVKHYMGRVLQKLCARNRTEAVILSRELASTASQSTMSAN